MINVSVDVLNLSLVHLRDNFQWERTTEKSFPGGVHYEHVSSAHENRYLNHFGQFIENIDFVFMDLHHELWPFAAKFETAKMRIGSPKSGDMGLCQKAVHCYFLIKAKLLLQTSSSTLGSCSQRRHAVWSWIMQAALYGQVVVKREHSLKATLSVIIFRISPMARSHERNEAMKQVTGMKFINGWLGSVLEIGWGGSEVPREFCSLLSKGAAAERSGRTSDQDASWASPFGGLMATSVGPPGATLKTLLRDYTSHLAWECLRIPKEKLETENDIWAYGFIPWNRPSWLFSKATSTVSTLRW